MKNKTYASKIFALALIVANSLSLTAQKLYNVSGNALFTFDIVTNTIAQKAFFTPTVLSGPTGDLVHTGNGTLVGVTNGSASLYGGIYKTDTTTNVITSLYQFTNYNKAVSGFVLANDGKLYTLGISPTTGSSTGIYSFDLATNAYVQEFAIAGNTSSNYARMIKATNGILYGVMAYGGANDSGILFSYNTSTSSFTSLYDFNTSNGTQPTAALLQAANGKLYGLTRYGGTNDKGVLFSYDIASNTYSKLHDFVQSNGESPMSPLIQATNGLLYGNTMAGGNGYGVLFSFNIATNTYTNLHNFDYTEGYGPRCSPIQATNGLLYGLTYQGALNLKGSIYSYDISSSTFSKVFDGNGIAGTFASPFFSFEQSSISIEENLDKKSISIYPNPSNGTFELTLDGTYSANGKLEIFNVCGDKVYTSSTLKSQMQINLSSFSKGLYIVNIYDETRIFSQKIVVQ